LPYELEARAEATIQNGGLESCGGLN